MFNYNTCAGVGKPRIGACPSASRSIMRSHYLNYLVKGLWTYSAQTLKVFRTQVFYIQVADYVSQPKLFQLRIIHPTRTYLQHFDRARSLFLPGYKSRSPSLVLQEVYCKSVLPMTELLERALAKPSKRSAKLKTLSASEQ